jgi:hypothetical protein
MKRRSFLALPAAALATAPTVQPTPSLYEWLRAELMRRQLQVFAANDWRRHNLILAEGAAAASTVPLKLLIVAQRSGST